MLPIASIIASLLLPITNKVIDTLGGLAKNTVNTLLNTAPPVQNTTTPKNNQIFF